MVDEAGSAWNIKSNELTVNTRRVAGYGLVKPAPENNIYTAALKVPIAEKWLEDDADDTFIYSDYTKLSEYIYDVKIAALRDDGEGIAKYSDTDSKHYHSTRRIRRQQTWWHRSRLRLAITTKRSTC